MMGGTYDAASSIGSGGFGSSTETGITQEFAQLLQAFEGLLDEMEQQLGQQQPGAGTGDQAASPSQASWPSQIPNIADNTTGQPPSYDEANPPPDYDQASSDQPPSYYGMAPEPPGGSSGSTGSSTDGTNTGSASGGGASGSQGGLTTAETDVASALKADGITNVNGIAGAIGNEKEESLGNSDEKQGGTEGAPTPGVAGNSNGYGDFQWGGSRENNLLNFAVSEGKSASDPQVQAAFTVQEVDADPALKSALQNATSPGQAAQAWEQDFEQASDPNMGTRVADANQAAQALS